MNEEECSRGVMSRGTANYPSVTLAVTSVITISFCLSKVMGPHPPAELGFASGRRLLLGSEEGWAVS